MRTVRVATVAFLMEDAPHTIDHNFERVEFYVCKAVRQHADIICFPETTPTLNVRDVSRELIVSASATWLERFRVIARQHQVHLIAPMYTFANDEVRNRAYVITETGGVAGFYDKLQPTGAEKFVTEGDSLPIISTRFGPVAIMICLDIYFPEIARLYAMKGAALLFWPTLTLGPTQTGLESQLRSRAIDNSLHIIESNLACAAPYAPYNGRSYPGNARIMDFNGDILASTGRRDGIAIAEIDLDEERVTSSVFLKSEPDHTRNDVEHMARIDFYAKEYEALARQRKAKEH